MSEVQIINVENRLTAAEAARLINVSPNTIIRWAREGVRGVRLQSARLGSRLYTSQAAIDVFMNRLAEVHAAERAALSAA